MTPFSAVGLELWSMTSDIFFDNFIICTERAVADDWASDGWGLKKAADGAAEVREEGLIVLLSGTVEASPLFSLTAFVNVCLYVLRLQVFFKPGRSLNS